jgi:predicted DNA-binding ribbon-helix-helix protein
MSIAGHRTSLALEPEFWRALTHIAARRGLSLPALVASVDGARDGRPLASALRVAALSAGADPPVGKERETP